MKFNIDHVTSVSTAFGQINTDSFQSESNKYKITISSITFKLNGRFLLTHLPVIVMIKSDSNYSMIYLKSGQKVLTSKTLKYWEDMIQNPRHFIRCHSNCLVNKSYIQTLDKAKKCIILHDASQILCSRRRWKSTSNHLFQPLDHK